MSAVTDKKFFTSTLIQAAGCTADTFRSWRNRNGLFPETQDSGTWNKFSIIDMFVARLVIELTSRGVAAQTAVDTSMAASPVLAAIFDHKSANADDMEEIFLDVGVRCATKPILALYPSTNNVSPTARVISAEDSARVVLREDFCILLNLEKLIYVVGHLIMNDVEFEDAKGQRKLSVGAISKLDRREPLNAAPAPGKLKTVRRGRR